MIRSRLSGLLMLLLAAGNAAGAEPSLCARLADEAKRLPSSAWAQPQPLQRWLQWLDADRPRPLSPVEQAMATDPRWRDKVGATSVVGVQHLAGTPVYRVESFAGTANCQSLVLLQAGPGQPVQEIAPPFALGGEDMSLCVTQSARFARVLGQPALVVGGPTTMAGDDATYRIAAWADGGWAPACELQLARRSALTPGRRFCAPGAAVCEAGQGVAQDLALAFEADRTGRAPLDAARFWAGQTPPAAVQAALNPALADAGAVGDFNLPLPLFGADERGLDPMTLTSFSNAGPQRLPVFIAGRWWLAVVGRSGVGWRQGDAVLVALFAPPGRAQDAVASYQFVVGPAGLVRAMARNLPR